MITRRWLARATGFAALLALAGCTGGGGGSYARVYGTVTHNGVPVDGAKVKFVGTTETQGGKDEFTTTTDSGGKYAISGVGDKPGIPPGRYKVVITKLSVKKGGAIPDDFDQTQLEMSGLGVNSLPKEYGDAGTTKLTATVEPGKNENVNFDLTGK
jgi:hypothetical protein